MENKGIMVKNLKERIISQCRDIKADLKNM